MSASYWFDAERVLAKVRAGLETGLDEAANRIAGNARQRAPIRKVFKEPHGLRFRSRELTKTSRNMAGTLAVKYYYGKMAGAKTQKARSEAEFGMLRSVGHTRRYARVMVPNRASANTLAHSGAARQLGTISGGRFTSDSGATRIRGAGYEPGAAVKGALSSRGLYEVRSGRAIHISVVGSGNAKRVQIGGALKASIGVVPGKQSASGISREVVAAIRYAKFVEFPTIHNRAQPFLLPALKDEQRTFTKDVASSIRRSLGGG